MVFSCLEKANFEQGQRRMENEQNHEEVISRGRRLAEIVRKAES